MTKKKEIISPKRGQDKEKMENVKKTIAAYNQFSDDKIKEETSSKLGQSKEESAETKEVTEEMIKEEIGKEVMEEEKEKHELLKEIEEKNKKAGEEQEVLRIGEKTREQIISEWEPKTKLGRDVKNGKIKNIDEILNKRIKILEPEIVDSLVNLKLDLISIGQSKGKFGGGKRRAWRQTQRKTQEGNIPSFSTMAVVGDENGHVGIGSGKAKETLPARDKSIRKAKLNIFKVYRECSSFDCSCNEPHTVPFIINGRSGGVRITLMPAPQGTGLVVAKELKKVLKLAGIKDIYSKTFGNKRTSFNIVKACIDALKKTSKVERRG